MATYEFNNKTYNNPYSLFQNTDKKYNTISNGIKNSTNNWKWGPKLEGLSRDIANGVPYQQALKNNGLDKLSIGMQEKLLTDIGFKQTKGLENAMTAQNKLDLAGGIINGIGTAANIGLGIYGAIEQKNMFDKQLQHAQDVFGFEKGLANRNLANQATMINEQVASRSNLAGIYAGRDNYGTTKAAYYDKNRVDGSPIG